jgi:hypothetical protein
VTATASPPIFAIVGVAKVGLASAAFHSVLPSFAFRARRHPQDRMIRSPAKIGELQKCSSSSAVSTIRIHFSFPCKSWQAESPMALM